MVGFLRGTEGLDSGSEALYSSHVRRGHLRIARAGTTKKGRPLSGLLLYALILIITASRLGSGYTRVALTDLSMMLHTFVLTPAQPNREGSCSCHQH